MNPGEYLPAEGDIAANLGRETRTLSVTNLGDRPIQVGSHYHFYETNPALQFEREAAKGFRLNIPSGNAVRFEPGERKTMELVAFGGAQILQGFRNETDGKVPTAPQAADKAALTIPRAQYLATYGATVGDKIRSSPPAASTATSTSSARSRSRKRWSAASPPCSAAAPARPPAPMPPPARRPLAHQRMLQAADAFPMNLGFLGKGNASLPERRCASRSRRRHRPEAARGLGHHARRPSTTA
jgi:urease subunit beta